MPTKKKPTTRKSLKRAKSKYKWEWEDDFVNYKSRYSPSEQVSQEDIANIGKLNKTINFKIKEKENSVFLDVAIPEFIFDPEKAVYAFSAHKEMKFNSINIQVHDRKYCLGLSTDIIMNKGDTLSVPLETEVYDKLLYLYENK